MTTPEEVNMVPDAIFEPGDRVRVVRSCPIDFEGVGPLPGDVGEVVKPPEHDAGSNVIAVRFDRVSARWSIPGDYLERAS